MVQAVLLFCSDTWLVTPCMGRALGGFQDQVARQMTGRLLWRKTDSKWWYTSAEMAREEAGFHTMEDYILQTTEHNLTLHRYAITARPV